MNSSAGLDDELCRVSVLIKLHICLIYQRVFITLKVRQVWKSCLEGSYKAYVYIILLLFVLPNYCLKGVFPLGNWEVWVLNYIWFIRASNVNI